MELERDLRVPPRGRGQELLSVLVHQGGEERPGAREERVLRPPPRRRTKFTRDLRPSEIHFSGLPRLERPLRRLASTLGLRSGG